MKNSNLKFLLLGSIVIIGISMTELFIGSPQVAKASEGHGKEPSHGDHSEEGDLIRLDEAQIVAAGIKAVPAGPGILRRESVVPGKIVAAADRMAQIVPKIGGTVAEARKNLGDAVEKGEVVAVIESRDMAEAMAEYLAAKRAEELSRINFNREKGLWDKKITAEQDYLTAKNRYQEAKIRLDLTSQKLRALGHEGKIDEKKNTRFHELKAPFSGRVIDRELTLGEYVDATHSAYTIANLSVVWVETAIASADIPFVKEGQIATVTAAGRSAEGRLIFMGPVVDPATKTAKAIIALDNAEGLWRPGEFSNVAIGTNAEEVPLILPKEAIQNIENADVVFIRQVDGFEKRIITTGREDSRNIEILSGLSSGEMVAVANTFTLKAELGKAEAEHEH